MRVMLSASTPRIRCTGHLWHTPPSGQVHASGECGMRLSRMWTETGSGVNPLATAFELEHYFQTAKPTIIATETGLLDNVERAMRALNIDSRVILIEKDVSGSRSSHLTVSTARYLSLC